MAERGDKNKRGSASRKVKDQSRHDKHIAHQPAKGNVPNPKPSRTSSQGRKESSGGETPRSSESD